FLAGNLTLFAAFVYLVLLRWEVEVGRARVLLVNEQRLPAGQLPRSIYDLGTDRWPANRVGVALPLFGTSASHAAALAAALGQDRALAYYQRLVDRGVRVVGGNSVVRDLVASGALWVGLTDTDDACGAKLRGKPVRLVFPDQAAGELGTLLIFGTVAVVAGAPHPSEAARLVDYLASRDTEQALLAGGWAQVPLRADLPPPDCLQGQEVRHMDVTPTAMLRELEPMQQQLRTMFLR
ncbi:MAG: ABC transporter substrate-binding protein, partial [Deltaproteobacteria bacterium]